MYLVSIVSAELFREREGLGTTATIPTYETPPPPKTGVHDRHGGSYWGPHDHLSYVAIAHLGIAVWHGHKAERGPCFFAKHMHGRESDNVIEGGGINSIYIGPGRISFGSCNKPPCPLD